MKNLFIILLTLICFIGCSNDYVMAKPLNKDLLSSGGVSLHLGIGNSGPSAKIQWIAPDSTNKSGLVFGLGFSFSGINFASNYKDMISENTSNYWGDKTIKEYQCDAVLSIGGLVKETDKLWGYVTFDWIILNKWQTRYDPSHILSSNGEYKILVDKGSKFGMTVGAIYNKFLIDATFSKRYCKMTLGFFIGV